MRITVACGLRDSRSRAGFWKNSGAAVRAVRTIQNNTITIDSRSRAGFWKNDGAAVRAVRTIQYNTIQ